MKSVSDCIGHCGYFQANKYSIWTASADCHCYDPNIWDEVNDDFSQYLLKGKLEILLPGFFEQLET